MTPEELRLMDEVRAAYITRTKIGCTGCRYCMPCPNGVNIPGTFSAWNNVSLYGADPRQDWNFTQMVEKGETPDNCVACGACEAACPQHLGIIEGLKDAWSDLNR
jgi:predicted aldo/keto reductase-like oxidoreductase